MNHGGHCQDFYIENSSRRYADENSVSRLLFHWHKHRDYHIAISVVDAFQLVCTSWHCFSWRSHE